MVSLIRTSGLYSQYITSVLIIKSIRTLSTWCTERYRLAKEANINNLLDILVYLDNENDRCLAKYFCHTI